MKIIGITGGIGSGKSLVSQILRNQGFFVYDSDSRAKYLMNSNQDLILSIKQLFGNEIYLNQELNRKEIAKQVFSNPELLKKLNILVHPKVKEDFDLFLIQNQNEKIIFKESAILFESNSYKICDATLLITADLDLRISRVIERDKISKEEILKRINNQISEQEKIKKADFVIYNNSSILELTGSLKQILSLLKHHLTINNNI